MKKIPAFKLVPEPQGDDGKNLPKFKWTGKEIWASPSARWRAKFLTRCVMAKLSNLQGANDVLRTDSINDDICIADCGMIYVFVCFDCFQSVSMVQSY